MKFGMDVTPLEATLIFEVISDKLNKKLYNVSISLLLKLLNYISTPNIKCLFNFMTCTEIQRNPISDFGSLCSGKCNQYLIKHKYKFHIKKSTGY